MQLSVPKKIDSNTICQPLVIIFNVRINLQINKSMMFLKIKILSSMNFLNQKFTPNFVKHITKINKK